VHLKGKTTLKRKKQASGTKKEGGEPGSEKNSILRTFQRQGNIRVLVEGGGEEGTAEL